MGTLAHFYHWPERFILWELPLPRAVQYFHLAIFRESPRHWTVAPGTGQAQEAAVGRAPVEDQLAALDALPADEVPPVF